MRQKINYRGFIIYIGTAPAPFAQFVDCYEDKKQIYIGIQDQDSCAVHELGERAKKAIDRYYNAQPND